MQNLNDLRAFLLVAETGSFTKAAARMGVSQSALSYTVRSLENQLKIKLLERTTRSVATTSAGEELRRKIKPLFSEIDSALTDLNSYRGRLSGTLRINGNEHVFQCVLKQRLIEFSREHPEIRLELISENRFIDIITDRFDMGIRMGDHVARDMIAVRVSDDIRMITAASPEYLKTKGMPNTPLISANTTV